MDAKEQCSLPVILSFALDVSIGFAERPNSFGQSQYTKREFRLDPVQTTVHVFLVAINLFEWVSVSRPNGVWIELQSVSLKVAAI